MINYVRLNKHFFVLLLYKNSNCLLRFNSYVFNTIVIDHVKIRKHCQSLRLLCVKHLKIFFHIIIVYCRNNSFEYILCKDIITYIRKNIQIYFIKPLI